MILADDDTLEPVPTDWPQLMLSVALEQLHHALMRQRVLERQLADSREANRRFVRSRIDPAGD